MKLLLLFGFYISLSVMNNGYSQVVVRGFIHDSNRDKAILYEPINGFYNDELAGKESFVDLGSNGSFEKNLNLKEPIMICMRIGIIPIQFFAEPGDTIEVTIDVDKFNGYSPNGGIGFKGRNAAGNEFFNELNFNPGRKIGNFKAIIEDSLHLWQNFNFETIDYGLARITSGFDTLLGHRKITKRFYDDVVPGIKSLLISQLIRDLLVSQKGMSFQDAVALVEKIYSRYLVSSDVMKKSAFGRSIANFYFMALAARHYPSCHFADSTIVINNEEKFVNSNLVSWLYAPDAIQEIYWPVSLIRLKRLFADSYGKRDIETFMSLHPNSPVKKYLKPPYFDDIEFAGNEADSSSIHIINDTTTTSLAGLLKKHFPGDKIYIDFWASWCVPCKQEFHFNASIDSFCNKYNIKRLYIAFDAATLQIETEKDIYAYNLKGFHIQATKPVFEDVIKKFYPDREFSIPRYLLIDEDGEVVNDNAPRPSSGNALFTEMKERFHLKE